MASLYSQVSSSESCYATAEELYQEIRPCWSKMAREAGRQQLQAPKKEAARAFLVYQNAMNPNMPLLLLGAEKIRDYECLTLNFGTISSDPQFNRKTIKEFFQTKIGIQKGAELNKCTELHLTQGAIINESNWWLLPNDLMILGGIHGNKDFHVVYHPGIHPEGRGIPSKDFLWDNREKRPRVLGREVAMLAIAGYIPMYVSFKKCRGLVFTPPEVSCKFRILAMRQKLITVDEKFILDYLRSAKDLPITPVPSSVLANSPALGGKSDDEFDEKDAVEDLYSSSPSSRSASLSSPTPSDTTDSTPNSVSPSPSLLETLD